MLKLYGAEICSDCREAKRLLEQQAIEYQYIDITVSTKNLKEFLAMRDSLPLYDSVRAEGRIGIPTFVWDDGTVSLDTGWLKHEFRCADC